MGLSSSCESQLSYSASTGNAQKLLNAFDYVDVPRNP